MELLSVIISISVILLGWLFILLNSRGHTSVVYICALAFVVRISLAWLNIEVVQIPGSGKDDIGFRNAALEISALEGGHWWNQVATGKRLYENLLAISYKHVSRGDLVPLSVNVTCGTLTVLFVWLLSFRLSRSIVTAAVAAILCAVWPTLAIYSALLLRDSLVICFTIAGAYYLVGFLERPRLFYFTVAGICWLGALSFHTGAVALLPGLILASVFVRRQRSGLSGGTNLPVILGVAAGCIVLALVPLSTGWGMDKFRRYQDMELAEAVAQQQTARDHRNRAAYLQELQPTSGFDLLWQTPIRMVYFLFTPFPWMIASGTDVFGLLVMLLGAWLLWRLFRARRELMANRSALLVLFTASCLVIVFAVGVTNYGTAIRHRTKVVPLLLVCIPAFFSSSALRHARQREWQEATEAQAPRLGET